MSYKIKQTNSLERLRRYSLSLSRLCGTMGKEPNGFQLVEFMEEAEVDVDGIMLALEDLRVTVTFMAEVEAPLDHLDRDQAAVERHSQAAKDALAKLMT